MANCPPLGTKAQVALAGNAQAWAAGMTGRTLGAGDAVPVLSETLKRVEQKEENAELVGQAHQRRAIHLGNMPSGDVVFQGDYNYLPKSLAFAMGIAGTPVETEATFQYTHRLQQDDCLVDTYATLGVNRGVDKTGSAGDETVWQYQAAKANGFTFSAAQGETCKLTIPWLMRELLDNVDATAWSYIKNVNSEMEYMLLSQAVLRINAAGGAALAPSDALDLPVGVELVYAPNLESDQYDDGGARDEPIPRNPPTTRLSVTWTRINQTLRTLLVEAFNNTSELKADLIFTGSVLGAGAHAATFSFPSLYVDSDLDYIAESPDLIGFPVEFHCQRASAAPLGMTGIVNPVDISIVNNVNADPLATV